MPNEKMPHLPTSSSLLPLLFELRLTVYMLKTGDSTGLDSHWAKLEAVLSGFKGMAASELQYRLPLETRDQGHQDLGLFRKHGNPIFM